MSIEKVRQYFQPLGREQDILEFETSSATVELAAQAAGVIPARIAKTLSFLVDEGCVLIVTAGDAKIDNSKFKAMFHAKAKMLSPEQVYSFTGHAVGGVCPFCVKEGVKVYLDPSMRWAASALLPTRTGYVPTWMCPSSASRLSSPRRAAATPRSSSPVTSWRSTPTAWDGSTCARAGRRPPDPVFPSERSALFPWRQKTVS